MRFLDTIVLHHSASRAGVHSWADIRAWHLAKGWTDVGYHYGVVFDGEPPRWQVATGRPLDVRGAHAKGFNSSSVGVCFEGSMDAHPMPDEQFELGASLVASLLQQRPTITRVVGHRELCPTACPGKLFPLGELVAEAWARSGRARPNAAA